MKKREKRQYEFLTGENNFKKFTRTYLVLKSNIFVHTQIVDLNLFKTLKFSFFTNF